MEGGGADEAAAFFVEGSKAVEEVVRGRLDVVHGTEFVDADLVELVGEHGADLVGDLFSAEESDRSLFVEDGAHDGFFVGREQCGTVAFVGVFLEFGTGDHGFGGFGVEDPDFAGWRVVAVFHARCTGRFALLGFEGLDGRGLLDAGGGKGVLEVFHGDGTRTEDLRPVAGGFDYGGFQADLAFAAVNDVWNSAVEVFEDVLEFRRGRAAGTVGRRGRDRDAAHGDEFLGDRVHRETDPDGVEFCGDAVRDRRVFLHDDGDRARHEGIDKSLCDGRDLFYEGRDHVGTGDMDDKRVVGGAAFGFVNFGHRFGVSGIAAEAVDGFSRKSHNFAFGEGAGGIAHAFFILHVDKDRVDLVFVWSLARRNGRFCFVGSVGSKEAVVIELYACVEVFLMVDIGLIRAAIREFRGPLISHIHAVV